MRLACSTLLYTNCVLDEALKRIGEHGFHYVDIAAMEGWANIHPSSIVGQVERVARQIQEACSSAALVPVAFNADVKGTLEEQIQQLDALASLAGRLSIPVITLGAAASHTSLAEDLVRFRRFERIVAGYSVQLTIETHFYTHTENPAVALRYVQEIPELALTLDPGHFAIGPYWNSGIEVLFPYVKHVHLRPAGLHGWQEVQLAADQGCIDFPLLLQQLQSVGYDGACSVEYVDSIGDLDYIGETKRLRQIVEPLFT